MPGSFSFHITAPPNRTLKPESLIETLDRLYARISERFPNRGLTRVAADLCHLARRTAKDVEQLAQPYWLPRLASYAIIGLGIVGMGWVIVTLRLYRASALPEAAEPFGFAQGLEAAANLAVLCAVGLFFMLSLEARLKRRKCLNGLHELRSVAHVIDMHQLTKDPKSMLTVEDTPSSPERDLSPAELIRYLDYCMEMLALISKLAALYAENLPDNTVMTAVNDVETLTSSLNDKIFQKIVMVQSELAQSSSARNFGPPLPVL